MMLWPRRSFRRSARYFMVKALRLQGSPHAVAAGLAIGVFCTFTPFVGLHFLLAIVLAWLVRASVIAAATGTALGNPITLPFIWGATLQVGQLVLQQNLETAISANSLGNLLLDFEFARLWDPLLKPMLVGSVLLGGVAAVITYFLVFMGIRRLRRRRRTAGQARATARIQPDGSHPG